MAKSYVGQLAELTGFQPCRAGRYKVAMIEAACVGRRDGYIVALGPSRGSSYAASIRVFIRFASTRSEALIRPAMEKVAVEFDLRRFEIEIEDYSPDAESEEANSGASPLVDSVTLDWGYVGKRPSPEKVAALLDASIKAIGEIAQAFPEVCEICKRSPVSGITLRNGTPGYYCPGCREQQIKQHNRAALEYEKLPANSRKTFRFMFPVAVLAGLLDGYLLAWWLPRITSNKWATFAFGASLVYLPIMLAADHFLGFAPPRQNPQGWTAAPQEKTDEVMLTLMCPLGALVANISFYVFVVERTMSFFSFGPAAWKAAIAIFLEAPVEHVGWLLSSLFLAFVMAALGLRHLVPSPQVTFEDLRRARRSRS